MVPLEFQMGPGPPGISSSTHESQPVPNLGALSYQPSGGSLQPAPKLLSTLRQVSRAAKNTF